MKGILMTLDNHKAVRGNNKVQTRRLDGLKEINKEPNDWVVSHIAGSEWEFKNKRSLVDYHLQPRYKIGETVYIKEAHCIECFKKDSITDACYKTDDDTLEPTRIDCDKVKWRFPMFMPEWAARDFIKVTDILAQRLQEISNLHCIAEGISPFIKHDGVDVFNWLIKPQFRDLWDSINAKRGYPWKLNPWVWGYLFTLLDKG